MIVTSQDQNALTHTKKLGNSQFEVFCQSHPETSRLIFSIQKYTKKFPAFYYSSILSINKGRSIDTIQKRLTQQLNKLTNNQSFYQIISKSLQSRENCISKIKRQLTKAQRVFTLFKKQYPSLDDPLDLAYLQYVSKQGYTQVQAEQTIEQAIMIIRSIFINLSRLREMTLYVIEMIHKWKLEIEEWTDRCGQYQPVFFYYNEINVYDIVMQDTNFVWESSLSEYVYISEPVDPFMVRNVLQVEKREQMTSLEKYFVEILYPKEQSIVTRAVKCYEMLTFKYESQDNNLYKEEELLIENYLSLKKQQNDEQHDEDMEQAQMQWKDKKKRQHKNNYHTKGWVFGKILKKPNTQRIKDMIKRHQEKITFIKPYSIANQAEKKSLALAYIAKQLSHSDTQSPTVPNKAQITKQQQIARIYSTNKLAKPKRSASLKIKQQDSKGYRSQNQPSNQKLARMYQSLTKIHPVIIEDPQEHMADTPNGTPIQTMRRNKLDGKSMPKQAQQSLQSKLRKNIHAGNKNRSIDRIIAKNVDQGTNLTNLPTINKKNVNPIFNSINQLNSSIKGKIQQIQKINQNSNLKSYQSQKNTNNTTVDTEQKQITFMDFLWNFRSNTNKPSKKLQIQTQLQQQRKQKLQQKKQKLQSIRHLVQKNSNRNSPIMQRYSNIKSKSNLIKSQKLKNNPSNRKQNNQKSDYQAQNSFNQYKEVSMNLNKSSEQSFKFEDEFIVLTSKSIPNDIVPDYLRYVFDQQHSTSKKFTLYSYDSLLEKLQDPNINCLIFQVSTELRGSIGQVILSEQLGTFNQRLKYVIQYINIHIFELVVASVLRIAEELLYATPCQQVICPLMEDKLNPVSVHFVELIEKAFKARVGAFGYLTILQKKKTYYMLTDMYERLYVFTTKDTKTQQLKISKAMMGNYRSLKFQCKCLLLTSNFRMRSKSTSKSVISNYQSTSIGCLYRSVLQRILTKFHLKQMKFTAESSNQVNQSSSLVKSNSFLRSLITSLAQSIKQQKSDQDSIVKMTKFQNMQDVLTYLQYKQYSKYFAFSFLQQSRFILNHQLLITEFEADMSLQFMVRSSVDFMILYNHRNLAVRYIQPDIKSKVNQTSKAKSVIIPTTDDNIDLIFIDGRQYQLQTTDKLDLFTYLYIYQQNNFHLIKQAPTTKQILIPNIHKLSNNPHNVKLFEGLFQLFPQRQFYSGTYLKCTNLWQSFFPSAVIYKPQLNSIVFQYPLIIGFISRKSKQIITAFILRQTKA